MTPGGYCPHCGRGLEELYVPGSPFCPYCGMLLPQLAVKEVERPPSVLPVTSEVLPCPPDSGDQASSPQALPYRGLTPETQGVPEVTWASERFAGDTLRLGLVSFIFPPLIPIVWILALVNAIRLRNHPEHPCGGWRVVVGLLASIGAAVMYSLLVDSLRYAQMNSKGTVCAANLKGIATGFYTYGNENGEQWPRADHVPAIMNGIGEVDYSATIGLGIDGQWESDKTSQVLSTTRNLWTLVRTNASTPKSFICPSSEDGPNNADNPQNCWDFGGITNAAGACVAGGTAKRNYEQVSYGYQVPYGQSGVPGSNLDPKMILAADKGPFGANIEAGKAAPGRLDRMTGKSSAGDRGRFNSPNHSGAGQNVLLADGHVEFFEKANVGIDGDNIYTRWGTDGKTLLDRLRGAPPTAGGKETPMSDTDSFIYP